MGQFFEVRDSQSRAKHSILRRYAGAWSGIIGRGMLRHQRIRANAPDLHLVFVDGFAGEGRYQRDADQPPGADGGPTWGSPVIGMQALEDQVRVLRGVGLRVAISGIVCEKDQGQYRELLRNLRAAGLDTPVEEATSFKAAARGRLHAFCNDFRDLVDPLLAWLGSDSFVLALVDPFGPVMDLDTLGKLLGRQMTDGITLFPLSDVVRKGGSAMKTEEDWEPGDRGNITRIGAHFGTDEWARIYSETEGDPVEREWALQELYFRQLDTLDPALAVKRIRLRFSKIDRTAYYLYLTTRNGDGALRMNKVLREAEVEEEWQVWRDEKERLRQREDESAQENIFGLLGMDMIALPEPRREEYKADPETVREELLARCPPGEYSVADIYTRAANTTFIATEIDRALRELRESGAVRFPGAVKRNTRVTILSKQ